MFSPVRWISEIRSLLSHLQNEREIAETASLQDRQGRAKKQRTVTQPFHYNCLGAVL